MDDNDKSISRLSNVLEVIQQFKIESENSRKVFFSGRQEEPAALRPPVPFAPPVQPMASLSCHEEKKERKVVQSLDSINPNSRQSLLKPVQEPKIDPKLSKMIVQAAKVQE